jgi:hypothetical protein
MLDIEPRSVAVTMKYKKENQMFSSYFLFLETMCLVHFSRLFPSNHICQLPLSGYRAIAVSKIAMQRVLENELRVFIRGKHLPG